jgi:colanic acid/amylovoran biosynthesis glycosyltransferase
MIHDDTEVNGALAVVINKTGSYTERFVERHIRESFGGRTVVVARRAGDAHALAQPLLVADARSLGSAARAAGWPGTLMAYARYSHWGIPTGTLAQRIRAFWSEHQVMAVLAEFGPLGCWIAPVARAHRVPVFVYFRGFDASSKLRSSKAVRAYRRMVTQIDGVFAVSAFLVDNLARVGVSHPNTHVIPSGTNPDLFRPGTKDPNLIVSVGRFVDKKRPDATVRAFAAAAASRPELRLEMVGQGPRLDDCRELARAMGVSHRVHFLGARDHRFVAELLSRARLYLQHSVTAPNGETEGLPSSIQEAMAAGAVVVSTRHAGIGEVVIDGQTGWLVDENDEVAYATALLRALEDPALTDRMAHAARRCAEEHLDTQGLQQRMEAVILRAVRAMGSSR